MSSLNKTIALVAALAAIALLTARTVEAQVLYGSIVGNIRDASDAPVPGAAVKVVHKETGQSRQLTTLDAGVYSFPTVPGGTYDVFVTKEGFQNYSQRDVAVTVNSVVRVDVKLQVGTLTESVQVTAQAAALQTDRSEVRAEVTGKTLENLPLPLSRNYQSIYLTLPGFTPPINRFSVPTNPSRSLSVYVNGTSSVGVNTRIDGATAPNAWLPFQSGYVPALESIETVNAVSNSFDAEQGMAGGAAVNVQIKSGTNELHGSAFEYHTNSAVKAKPFFLPAGQRNPKALLNQTGGTIGGPIKRNSLFYFASWERTSDHQSAAQYATVPSAAVRAGDMSASTRGVYDPATGNADGTGRQLFPGNLIPKTRMEPIVQKIVALTPLPTFPDRLTNNYYASAPYQFTRNVFDTKTNWNATPKLSLSARLGYLTFDMKNPTVFGDALGGPQISSAGGQPGHGFGETYNSTVAGTYVVTPNFIIDAYFGLTLFAMNLEPARLNEKVGLDFLGIPGTNGARRLEGGWPAFNLSNYTTLGMPADNLPIWNDFLDYQYVANANWTKGKHNIRFGFDMLREHQNMWEPRGGPQGRFDFGGNQTALRGGASPDLYNSYASFLLGLTSGVYKSNQVEQATTRMWVYSFYARDQWAATRRLTLSYGLRWEYFPMAMRNNRGMERYDFDKNQMWICGVGSVPADCGHKISKRGFGPRLGFAYRPTDTFVVRGGYGISYDPYGWGRNLLQNYPIYLQLQMLPSNEYLPATELKQGIPPVPPVSLGNGIIDIPVAYNVISMLERPMRAYVQSWNFTLQKQLKWGWVGQAGYVATRQVHQSGKYNLNVGSVGGGAASRPFFKKFGRSASTVVMFEPWGHTHYDSLQATLERRFAKGYQVNLSYTFSKTFGICCDNTSDGAPAIILPEYRNLNRAVMSTDRPHVFTASGIAELPFGKGKPWASGGGVPSAIAGGWQVNTLFSSYSGLPFSVSASGASLDAPGNSQRADLAKEKVTKLGGVGPGQSFFDPFAFVPVTEVRFGTAGFNSMRGPGAVNLDLGIFRNFRITERVEMQFRAEAFNSTNTPHFNNPGGNVSNMQLNRDGTIRSLAGYTEVLSTSGTGREGIDERMLRFGLRFRF